MAEEVPADVGKKFKWVTASGVPGLWAYRVDGKTVAAVVQEAEDRFLVAVKTHPSVRPPYEAKSHVEGYSLAEAIEEAETLLEQMGWPPC